MNQSTTSLPMTQPRRSATSPGVAPTPSSPDSQRAWGPIGRVLWNFRTELLWVVIFSAVANILLLTPTIYMLQVFDRYMVSANNYTMLVLTVLMLGFAAVMGVAEWLRSRLLVRAGTRFDDALNGRVFRAAFEAQLRDPQRLPQRPLTDLNQLRQFLTGNGIFAMADTPWSLLFIAVLFLMHPWLGWLSVLFCVVQLSLAFLARWLVKSNQKEVQEADLELNQFLQSKLRNAETVAAMGMQSPLKRLWLGLRRHQVRALDRSQDASAKLQSLTKWVQYTQQAFMLALGALLAIRGEISTGAMIASNALMGNALRPLGLLVQVWGQALDARQSWARLDELLRATPEDIDASLPALTGQVTLRHLSAKAPQRKQPILDQIDAEFKAGEMVAIMGPSGAGKSTLARCLLGLWPQSEGQVLIDGHDVKGLPRDELGPLLGYLPQDIELFEGTIAENIARFSDAPPDVIVDAAKRAGIHDMVLRLPKGYDTSIGEAGGMLSGGQRQRLGLARALLGQPRIVVLDEPNANLDDAGEAALMNALRDLKQRGVTVFMIVHRPHLLALADRLMVLEAGRMTRLAAIQHQAPGTETRKANP